jgi:transcriptional regulator with XRE-family HTH domain
MRLRHARKMRGLTQQALAKASGVKQASISEVETGESKSPVGTNLVKLALSLHVSPEWLASGKGPMQAHDSPLSPEAVNVARDWEKLAPEIRVKLADMIHQLAVTAESFGPPVEDEKVAAAYGKPGQKHRSK